MLQKDEPAMHPSQTRPGRGLNQAKQSTVQCAPRRRDIRKNREAVLRDGQVKISRKIAHRKQLEALHQATMQMGRVPRDSEDLQQDPHKRTTWNGCARTGFLRAMVQTQPRHQGQNRNTVEPKTFESCQPSSEVLTSWKYSRRRELQRFAANTCLSPEKALIFRPGGILPIPANKVEPERSCEHVRHI